MCMNPLSGIAKLRFFRKMFQPSTSLLKCLSGCCCLAHFCSMESSSAPLTREIVYGTSLRPNKGNVLSTYPKQLTGIKKHKCFTRSQLGESPHGLSPECRYRFPSVTAILDSTMSGESRARLERWQRDQVERLGDEGFTRMMDEKLEIGCLLHSAIESFLRSPDSHLSLRLDGSKKALYDKVVPFWRSVAPILRRVERPRDVVVTEVFVTHWKLCYKGKVDAVLRLDDSLLLVDWKTATGKKSTAASKSDPLAALYDNPIQMAAYVGALNADGRHSSAINKGAIILCKDTGKPADVIHMTEKDLKRYWGLWLERVGKFWKRMNTSDTDLVNFMEEEDDPWSEGVMNAHAHDQTVARMLGVFRQ